MVYCEKILVRYRYMLHENEANQLITCRFREFLIQLCNCAESNTNDDDGGKNENFLRGRLLRNTTQF